MSINQTLEQRGSRYGKFKDVASTTYALQEILRDAKFTAVQAAQK